MASVELEQVTKIFEAGVKVVDNLTLSIEDREFIVLVGPSGCGKSTTLRMIAGLEEVTSGTISIDGQVVNDVAPRHRDIAMVFQNYALYPHMTVYDNMAFGLAVRKVPKAIIGEKVRRAAEVLGITHLLGRRPKQLSGGQRQRVAVGRAIVREPKCFLFDEPLSNLDAKLRIEMRAELKRLHMDLGSTTVYVTHDQEEAMTLGDRVVVMKDGLVQQCGRALEIYREPANRFVASFLGSPPMNFLEGRLEQRGEQLLFEDGAAALPVPAWAREQVTKHVGQSVILGVRPEALSDQHHARFATSDNKLEARVTLVQPLGNRMDVHLATPKHPHLVAQFEAFSGVEPKQALTLFVDMNRIHFFAADGTGRALVRGCAHGAQTRPVLAERPQGQSPVS